MSRRSRRRLIAVLAVLSVFGSLGGVAAWFLDGYRAYVVHTGSMEPVLVPGDVVVDARAPVAIEAGDVITFRATATDLVTHRVVAVADDGTITTRGDANDSADPVVITRDKVVGAVTARIPLAGYLVVYLQHPTGLMSLATTVFSVVLLWELFFPGTAPAGASPARPEPTAVAEAGA